MRTFFVSCILLFFLFLGIFIGIQYAEYGIRVAQGKDEPPKAIAASVNAEGEIVELSLLGKTFTREELTTIQGEAQSSENLDEAASRNIYAEIGRLLGTWVEQGARGLAEMVLGWLDGLM